MEQFVLRGDDIFDLGTRLSFRHRAPVDQDALVGDQRGATLQLGKVVVRLRERPEHCGRLFKPQRGQGEDGLAWRQHGWGR